MIDLECRWRWLATALMRVEGQIQAAQGRGEGAAAERLKVAAKALERRARRVASEWATRLPRQPPDRNEGTR